MIDRVDLITKAAQLRKILGEDGNSPVDIFALVQNIENLTLVFYSMGDNLSGMCVKSEKNNNVIAINSSMTLGRQRFSLAHELYHLYYDDTMVSVCAKSFDEGGEKEREADAFASYFLMPPAELETKAESLALKHDDRKLSIDDVIRIEQYFGISHQAAVVGLKNSKYMNPLLVDLFFTTGVRRRAEAMGFSSDLYNQSSPERKAVTYGSYIDKAQILYDENIISSGKYEELLLDAFREDMVFGVSESGELID